MREMFVSLPRRCRAWLAAFSFILPASASAVGAPTLFLDADSPATGSNLDVQPLVTPMGNITFAGQIRDKDGDLEFDAAGAFGDVFDIHDLSSSASMTFGFDVRSITFIYGGNVGVFSIVARDIDGAVVDSFFQASTDVGQPAGPITLSGSGIRGIQWQDAGHAFAPIDNLLIRTVPEPMSLWLVVGIAAPLGRVRRQR